MDIAAKICDRLEQKKKEFAALVRVGDMVFSSEDKRFSFSEFRYCTEGKGYVVRSLSDAGVYCEGDIKGEGLYLSVFSITHVVRDEKIIWDERSIVKFRYRQELKQDNDDRCGFPIDLNALYEGRWLHHYSPLTENIPGSILVELITPFRDGKMGDLIVVNESDLEVLEISDPELPD